MEDRANRTIDTCWEPGTLGTENISTLMRLYAIM